MSTNNEKLQTTLSRHLGHISKAIKLLKAQIATMLNSNSTSEHFFDTWNGYIIKKFALKKSYFVTYDQQVHFVLKQKRGYVG